MRKILFRGKDSTGIMNYGWFYGSLDTSFNPDFPRIICKDKWGNTMLVTVDGDTVGQYVGLCDKNGKKIFEGDIVAPIYITPVGKLTEDLDYDRKGVIELVAGSYVIKRPNHNQIALYSLVELEDMGYVSNVGNVYRPKNNICFVEVIGTVFDNPELLEGV